MRMWLSQKTNVGSCHKISLEIAAPDFSHSTDKLLAKNKRTTLIFSIPTNLSFYQICLQTRFAASPAVNCVNGFLPPEIDSLSAYSILFNSRNRYFVSLQCWIRTHLGSSCHCRKFCQVREMVEEQLRSGWRRPATSSRGVQLSQLELALLSHITLQIK